MKQLFMRVKKMAAGLLAVGAAMGMLPGVADTTCFSVHVATAIGTGSGFGTAPIFRVARD